MSTDRAPNLPPGPFRVEQLSPGDHYELSNGNAIRCSPAGGSGARGTIAAARVIDSDPAVESAGIDAGFQLGPKTLRAPDVSVGVPDRPGWVKGVPPLAVEIADRGQDEAELQEKIAQLLEAGTQVVWVVRMQPPRHVEVHRVDVPVARAYVGQLLTAPGILKNPIPVEALWDREVAHEVTFHNLLERRGIESLEHLREQALEEGRQEGRQEGRIEGDVEATGRLLELARATLRKAAADRRLALSPAAEAAIAHCTELPTLMAWSLAIGGGTLPPPLTASA